jgi:hypothetical protein
MSGFDWRVTTAGVIREDRIVITKTTILFYIKRFLSLTSILVVHLSLKTEQMNLTHLIASSCSSSILLVGSISMLILNLVALKFKAAFHLFHYQFEILVRVNRDVSKYLTGQGLVTLNPVYFEPGWIPSV